MSARFAPVLAMRVAGVAGALVLTAGTIAPAQVVAASPPATTPTIWAATPASTSVSGAPAATRVIVTLGTAQHAPTGTAKLSEKGRRVLFADLDGDGRDDPVIVYGEKKGCHLGRIARRGDGIAVEPLAVGEGAPLFALEMGDLDGDGTKDLLSADPDGLLMHKGQGKGVFAPLAKRVVRATDLLFTTDACETAEPYVHETAAGRPAELVLPILGGGRVVRPGGDGAGSDSAQELLTEPRIIGREDGLLFVSAAPVWIGAGAAEIATVGPLLGTASPRLELSWWTREADGSLEGHKTSLGLPPGENAALAYSFDLEGDGRPEIALLTTPARLKSFFGEYALRIYHATDRADAPALPFYAEKTDINFWQFPAISFRSVPGGGDLMIAFYRGLMTAHLNVEIFSGDGKGSFEKGYHDVELASEKSAQRQFLLWTDVNTDGTADLVTADDKGLRIHSGLDDRKHPLSSEPSWTSPIVSKIGGTSISLSGDGAWSISFGSEGIPILRDLDGDGLCEALVLGSSPLGDTVTIDTLKRRAK